MGLQWCVDRAEDTCEVEQLSEFSLQIDSFIDATLNAIDNTLREIIFNIGDSVVHLTPVVTGRLRGNWQLTIGAPSNQSLIRYDKDGGVTLQDLQSKAALFTAGEVAYIVNNLMYSEYIEKFGRKSRYMVFLTEARFETIIAEAIRNNHI